MKHFWRNDAMKLLDLLSILAMVCAFFWWIIGGRRRGRAERVVEPVENHGGRIVLLGDSILDNRMYVSSGKSVADLLQKTTMDQGYEVGLFAVDGATIRDVGAQINQLPMEYNTPETVLVLSVGGNDFLSGSDYDTAEKEYVRLVERLRKVFGSCKLYLVNLYRPVDPLFLIYYRIIDKWNLFLKGLVQKGIANGIVDVFSVIKEPDDLVMKIEPSATGSAKIVTAIVDQVEG
jgi:hypothetical protein